MDGSGFGGWSVDRVEQALAAEERLVAAARARQLLLLQIADGMQVAAADGCHSLGEWVSGRLDVSVKTGRRLVAMSRRVADDPDLVSELADGSVSFDRAEVVSRIPIAARGPDLDGLDVSGLARVAAKHKRLTRVDETVAHTSQHFVVQPNLDESIWDVWGRLAGYEGAVVDKVLTERADLIPDLPDGRPMGAGYRRALALARLCEDSANPSAETTAPGMFDPDSAQADPGSHSDHLDSDEGPAAGGGRVPLVTVFVDGDGAEIAGGPVVGAGMLDLIACTGFLEIVKTEEGVPLGVGRKSRVISPKLRRFVLHRDGGCVAEGCVSRYRLQPHHVLPWTKHGETEPENLLTLCWFHHHVVIHGWGYVIDQSRGPGRIRFRPPGDHANHDPPSS